ncbi:GGDEF domain-containing protein [Clostridium aminobutyricum]|uniref:GGDEF domain-containing protein n=1 Tax=Clostridium aminobutyricum TaxID=33953 RepID=A0A939IG74_CLOAM|nr:GGDEF domain-containing protein [Clostridium aminobutyricum]MBN7772780.1 GGDEF domain-containing protein [Clostridium aminobutyricum]
MHNNLCILILSIYLTIEQLYYGFYVTTSGLIHIIHFITAFVMALYGVISGTIQVKKVKNVSWILKIYEVSFGFFGFAIAIARTLLVHNHLFVLPTIYSSVIYGFAVVFYFSPAVNFCIYGTTSLLTIFLLPIFQPDIVQSSFIPDILSNNIIAWIVSVINYRRYVKEFRNQKIICDKNKLLQAKTTKIEKINEALRYTSSMDELTNIYNRRKLNEILEIEYGRCRRENKKISLILLDIDLFKTINDTYGHNVGDMVLTKIGELLKNNVEKSEKVGRWGGEEFLIICPETDFEKAVYLAERIRKIIEEFNFHLTTKVTCSFGVATNIKMDTISNLLLRADMGLYKAKDSGRNRVENGQEASFN